MNSAAPIEGRPLHALMREPLHLAPDTPLRLAMASMSEKRESAIVVVCDGRPTGLFTERDAVRLCLETDLAEFLLGEACCHVPLTASRDTDFIVAYRSMLAAGERHLLVVDEEGILQGIVEEKDLVGHFGIEHFAHLDAVSRLMTCNVVSLRPFSTMRQAARALQRHSIGSVVVEDDGHPVGIVTLADLIRTLAGGGDLDRMRLDEVMSRRLITVEAEESVFAAARRMKQAGVRHLVVTGGGRTAGVLTEHDILQTLENRYSEVLRRIITEQAREIEAQRRHLRERDLLDQLLSRSHGLGLILIAEGKRVAFVNDAARKLLAAEGSGSDLDGLLADLTPDNRCRLRELMADPPLQETTLLLHDAGREIGIRAIGVDGLGEASDSRGLLLIANDEALARRTEEMLEFNHQVVREMPHMVVWVDAQCRVVHANQAVHEALGHAPRSLLGGPLSNLAPDCSGAGLEDNLRQLKGQGSRTFRAQLRARDGRVLPVEVFGSHLSFRGQDYYGGFIRDLTDQQVVEQALAESQQRLLALVQASPDFILVKDGRNRWQVANQAGLEMIGLSDYDYFDRSDEELSRHCPPAYADSILRSARTCAQAWKERKPLRAIQTLPHPDGGTRYLDMIKVPVFDEHGAPRALVVIGRDVTARVRAEQERDQSVERLRAAVAAMDDLLLVLDDRHHLVDHYPRDSEALRLHSPGPLLGRPIEAILPDHVFELYDAATRRLESSGRPQGFDYALGDGQGQDHWFGARLTVQSAQGGNRPGFTLLIRDISVRKRAEAHVNELNESLEERVAERTGEMQAALSELESFSYSISHDLRTPLRAIEGFSRLLETEYRERLDDTAHDYLSRIRLAAQRMANLIDDLLDLARLSRKSLQKQRVDLSGMAAEVVAELRERQPWRLVSVHIEAGLAAEADPMLMRAVLDNLLGNAWKFTEGTADAAIEVGCERCDGGHKYFVRDNGAGFDMTYADRLFKPFQRLHSQSEFEGTGIGLATIHRIVTRHGGRVSAEGHPGEGACFRFTLGD